MSTTLFADVTAEAAAADMIQDLLGGRVIELTDDEAWRDFDDRTAVEDRLHYELMAEDLITADW